MKDISNLLHLLFVLPLATCGTGPSKLSLWVDEEQVKEFSGYPMKVFVITEGRVLPYLLDPNFDQYLPVIPAEVNSVNFTWKAGEKEYYYDFERLKSNSEEILHHPIVSTDRKGKVPSNPAVFQVILPCTGNVSGIAPFEVGLRIRSATGEVLKGTPLRLRLLKQCMVRILNIPGPDPECDKQCFNGGRCNHRRVCECLDGYMGKYCQEVICYPRCMNGGTCTSPGVCLCADGFQGPYCEGGICLEACLNGGKCIQKDTCACQRGYTGPRCEISKCNPPCLNGGRCIGIDKCKCARGYTGLRCQKAVCRRPCGRHGMCINVDTCQCDHGWYGRLCNRRYGSAYLNNFRDRRSLKKKLSLH